MFSSGTQFAYTAFSAATAFRPDSVCWPPGYHKAAVKQVAFYSREKEASFSSCGYHLGKKSSVIEQLSMCTRTLEN